MNVFLYYRTYWGKNNPTGWLGKNILANSKMEMVRTCIKSMEIEKFESSIIFYSIACVDNSVPEYTSFLESKFDEVFHTNEGLDITDSYKGLFPIWGMHGALVKLINLIKSKNHKPDDIVLIIEDDYLFIENGFQKWINACCHFKGFVSPYDHPFSYYRNDMFLKIKSIEIYNNIHWRESTCNTSVLGGKYEYFNKTKFFRKIPRLVFGPIYLERIFGAELPSIDVLFYRRIRKYLGIKLYSPIPGLAQHLSKWPNVSENHLKSNIDIPKNELSPGRDWEKRYASLSISDK
jgi:hypothetical protein